MKITDKIYIAGHLGMVGSAILRNLQSRGYSNFVLRSLSELDLMRQADVEAFFEAEKPDYVFLAAAKVGGIAANNTYRAQFIYENLMIQNNIIHSAWKSGVKKLLFLGSSCTYPKDAPQPLKEEYLLTGLLEETNEPYAIAKIAGIKMCESYYRQYGCDFISVMPTNLYGPNDNYDLEKSHVLPALIRKFHLARCLETNDWAGIREDLNKRPVEGVSGNSTDEEIITILEKYGVCQLPTADCRLPSAPSQPPPVGGGELLPTPDSRGSAPSLPTPVGGGVLLPTADCRLPSAPSQPPPVGGGVLLPTADCRLPTLTLWGSGNIHREFLHVNDMADACIHVMETVNSEKLYRELQQTHINIGTGIDLTIKELAETVKQISGFTGSINWDNSHPDGTLKKQLDISLLSQLNWKPTISLRDGIEAVYANYRKQ